LDDQDMEAQPDMFASYLLMPLPDYRQQVWRAVDLDVMRHCADRYGVSVTAAILKWLSYTEEKAIVVMSIDGYMKWSWSSTPAFKSGAFFRTRTSAILIPAGTLAANEAVNIERVGTSIPASLWFPYAEPQVHLREMKLYSDHYDVVMTLLVLPGQSIRCRLGSFTPRSTGPQPLPPRVRADRAARERERRRWIKAAAVQMIGFKISQGKRHNQALIALARRRCDVLFAMLRDGTLYSPPRPEISLTTT
jgi:hypothetical protein